MRARAVFAAVVLVGAAGTLSACQPRSDHAVINVDVPVALADQPVHVSVGGLAAGETVTVTAAATDHRQAQWRSRATFRADSHGQVNLDRTEPDSGTYSGVDGMGLFWSMNPPTGNPNQAGFLPSDPGSQPSYLVQVTVTAHRRQLAQRTLRRQWLAPGVTHKTLTPAADKVSGEMFLPPAGTPRRPGVLVLGGSEGGNSGRHDSALLASHGYPTLALAYFGEPGLPATLQDIPLDYFARAAHILATQPGVDRAHLVIRGYSRGTEAALLMGQYYPDLIHGVIVYAPTAVVNGASPDLTANAWTHNGHPIAPGTIPLDHVNGPLLAIAGADDHLWRSAPSARLIISELDQAHNRFAHQALIYPGAGHGVGTYPYLAAGTQLRHPVTGTITDLGGSRPANAAAQAQSWPKVLAFLTDLHD